MVATKKINYQQDLLKIPVKNMVLEQTAFSSPAEGQVKYDPTSKTIAWFDGTSERNLTGLTITELSSVKNYVDGLVAVNKAWKEVVLHENQLSNTNDCILQAIAIYLSGQPTANDTFIITDGTTTETFTFKASESVSFDVAIGGNVNATMANLVQAILDDSSLWDAVLSTSLPSINATDGRVVIIYRQNQLLASYNDRVYGTLTTQSNMKVISFAGKTDYDYSTGTNLPSADPTSKTFGFGRITSALTSNETHQSRSNDSQYTWDSDALTWNNTGTTGVSATAPIVSSGGNISLNYSKGLEVVSNNLEVKVSSTGAILKNTGTGTDELKVNVDNTTIEISANALNVKDNAITSSKINTSAVGTNLTGGGGTALDVNTSLIARRYNTTITGTGSQTVFTITHNKNQNTPASLVVVNNSTGEHEEVAWKRNSGDSNNAIDIEFYTAPTNGLVYEVRLTF